MKIWRIDSFYFSLSISLSHSPLSLFESESNLFSEVNVDTGAPMETLSEAELSDESISMVNEDEVHEVHVVTEDKQETAPAVLATDEDRTSIEYEQHELEPTPEGVVESESLQPVTPFDGAKASK